MIYPFAALVGQEQLQLASQGEVVRAWQAMSDQRALQRNYRAAPGQSLGDVGSQNDLRRSGRH